MSNDLLERRVAKIGVILSVLGPALLIEIAFVRFNYSGRDTDLVGPFTAFALGWGGPILGLCGSLIGVLALLTGRGGQRRR